MDSKNPDHLGLAGNIKCSRMLASKGKAGEVVKFSIAITKINKRNKEQHRAMLITNKAIYNLMPNKYNKCKRRIALEQVVGITASSPPGQEFVIHVPQEYDYRFKSANKESILDVLADVYAAIPGFENRTLVRYTTETDLSGVAVTKDKAKLMSRDQRNKLKEKLLQKWSKKDMQEEEKEAGNKNNKYSQISSFKTQERVDLRDFQLKKVLGRGSFGKVMLVRKKDDGKSYAMKILRKDAVIQRNQVEHTQAERAILQQLRHPFLMKLRYAFQSSSKLYLVLDFYQGGELFYHLKNMPLRRFSERTAKIYVGEIALALGYLHSLDVIYRDLKPENILLDPEGHVCLTDFGLAKEVKIGDMTDSFCGTPEYLAPEIVCGLGHDKAVDWWSLGILLYELTVGIPPFYAQNVSDMYNKIQHGVLRFPPFLTQHCKDLIVKLLNRDPTRRFGSRNDVEDLKAHPYFSDIDWKSLYDKKIVPDYVPSVENDEGALFDEEFTSEAVKDTQVMPSTLVTQNKDTFKGFTFAQESTIRP